MKKTLQHHCNGVHVYVLCMELGFSVSRSHRIACWFEKHIHPLIYRGGAWRS